MVRPHPGRGPLTSPTTDPLSPFVGALRADVERALGALLAPEAATLRWTGHEGAGLGVFAVAFTTGRGPVLHARLDAGDAPAPLTVVAHGLRLQIQRDSARRDPAFRALLAAIVSRFERSPAAASALREAVAAWRPYAAVEDIHYRRLSRSTQGRVGMLRLGFRCNQDCGFCWQSREWPEPPAEHYHRWLTELHAAGAERVMISGGEPTLHAELPALLSRARDLGLPTQIQSNAIKLGRPPYLARLTTAGLGAVLVSFHAADAVLSDTMTRAPGTWQRTVAGIEAALGAGLVVALNCVVDGRNATHLPDHAAFIVDRFVAPFPTNPVRVVNYSHPSPSFDEALWVDTLVTFDALKAPLGAALLQLEAAGVTVNAAGTCGFPLCVLPPGSRVAAGNAPDTADGLDLSARTWAPACRGCSARARCPGLRPEYVERYGARVFALP